ncbi:uncharacterized protein FIBRA_04301 [Fibroporia radiculosa]|uniref:Sodium/calcium exchanger membrane region domain-containing protein n=1 Tax=Fibroporia radiculosa TaxID=599839 RepID=J4IA35_9APHY|nr:uncharacterized protein FIBRA_04301 [Fibroporia radiculosa]CCM02221.1 predicted protein [Fibroporia radiculosa]
MLLSPLPSTAENFTSHHHGRTLPHPSQRLYPEHLRAIPLPIMTRSTSQLSATSVGSYSSTTELVPRNEPNEQKRVSLSEKLMSWGWRSSEKAPDSEMNELGVPGNDGGGQVKKKHMKLWQGWQYIFFGSWLNWILKLATTNSDTLIFTSCMLAMIPLVKLHDLAISVLSHRIGGSKTGLLNASFSNIVELVVAVSVFPICSVNINSSLIGSILSKMLLILGMCFFAGGLKFSQQDFDSSGSVAPATQIHSSLLSISVGAVCLPAAYHFALSYNSEDAMEAGTTLDQQKRDLLKMSHSVSFLLIFIYVSYLLFQLWSHTHLYKDNSKPSDKLPVTASMRSVTGRVRRKSNTGRSHSQPTSFRSVQSKQSFAGAARHGMDKASPVEEAPETTLDSPIDNMGVSAAQAERKAYLLSPFGTTSQVTLNMSEFGMPARCDPTVRLVREKERERGRSGRGSFSDGSTSSEDLEDRRTLAESGRASPVSDVVSAYFTERGDYVHRSKAKDRKLKGNGGIQVDVMEVCRGGAHNANGADESDTPTGKHGEEVPEMSWTMILILLTVVTVLVTVDAEWLVDSMDSLSPTLSKEWIGLILLPIVSSIAECVTAVNVSVKDQLTLSISVAVGSTIQTALFVIPFMVILGWILNKPLALLFDPFETVVLYVSVHIMGYVVADGKSNWLEGVILMCLYLVIAVTFWYYPGDDYVKAGSDAFHSVHRLPYHTWASVNCVLEFRRHKDVTNKVHVIGFLSQWKVYLDELPSGADTEHFSGKKLDPTVLEKVCHTGDRRRRPLSQPYSSPIDVNRATRSAVRIDECDKGSLENARRPYEILEAPSSQIIVMSKHDT